MRKIHVLCVALFAVLAFGAVAVASASAVTQWLVSGQVLAAPVSVESEGEQLICDDKGGLFLEKECIHCSFLDFGFVGAGAHDEITDITNLAGTSLDITDCTNDEGCPTPILVEELHLPWTTELVLEGAVIVDLILNSGTGSPGFEVECGGLVKDTCEATAEGTDVEIDLLAGPPMDVDALFLPVLGPGNCTRGGVGELLIEGEDLIFALEGLDLTVSDV